MGKHLSKRAYILVITGISILAVLAVALILSLALRADVSEARQAALAAAGGGEVVGQEIDQEGLWSEYGFDILNGSTWYEVEVNAFGKVTGLESSLGGYGYRD